MCGRYSIFTDAESLELEAIIRSANAASGGGIYKTGEIFPTERAPVIAASDSGGVGAAIMGWGWKNILRSVIINARSESVSKKELFRDDFLTRRCAIPSTGFYEWSRDPDKTKYLFRLPGEVMLYMAGFWRPGAGFIILTTSANDSMRDIHSRMPVILTSPDIRTYIGDPAAARALITAAPPELMRSPAV